MTPRLVALHDGFAKWLETASLLEVETIVRCVALELATRSMPDTRALYAYAELLSRVRHGAAPRNPAD